MWEQVEFRELRVFFALAEQLHFGRASMIGSFPDDVRHPAVTFVPIRDLPPMSAGLVWRAGRETPAIRAFAQAAAATVTAA